MKLIIVYLLGINVLTFAVYGWDKYRAVRRKWRISERALLAMAAAGGSAGALCGMLVFRHKIRKGRFAVGVPVMLLVHAGLLWLMWTSVAGR